MPQTSLLAIIPAAGRSRRMGRPKLLLPWRGTTVIAHLVGELRAAGVTQIFVVIRSDDQPLRAAVVESQAIPVQPTEAPPDMRSSVEYGLKAAAAREEGLELSSWLLIPADHPIVSRTTVTSLKTAWHPGQRQILIPTFAGQRGHPTLFSSDFQHEVASIPADCGLNWLVRQNAAAVHEIPMDDAGAITDLDTPEDYARLLNETSDSS